MAARKSTVKSGRKNTTKNQPLSPQDEAVTDLTSTSKSTWVSERLSRFDLVSFLAGLLGSVMILTLDRVLQGSDERDRTARLVATIKAATVQECRRIQTGYATLYDGYPTTTCDMNLYRVPEPDRALVQMLQNNQQVLVSELGERGLAIARNFSMSADGYQRLFDNKYFEATVSPHTSTFQSYFNPIQRICLEIEVPIAVQDCPWD